jgi:N-acylneuraminate cytidylyltransferase
LKILALIPARSGSKGVLDKNIRMLGQKPLIAYSIEAALKSKSILRTIVSTDSEVYAGISKNFGAEVPFIRPAYLAEDNTASIDVVLHALEYLSEKGDHYDAVCLLQPTSPFRSNDLIDRAIEKFIESNADALISVLPVPHEFNPHWTFEPTKDNYLKIATGESSIIKRRQDLPPAFIRDGSIYITKTSVLLGQKSFYGDQLTYIINDPALSVNIDTEHDWKKAEEKLHLIQDK